MSKSAKSILIDGLPGHLTHRTKSKSNTTSFSPGEASGTGNPQNTTGYWPAACTAATQVAQALANQNAVSNAAATSVNVNFLYNGTPMANCTFTGQNAFGVNPQVQVKVVRGGLPTFFSRI